MSQNNLSPQTLSDKADARERSMTERIFSKVADGLMSFGLLVSALLTIVYLTLLVEEAITLPYPYGYLFGVMVGIVAVVPAELALFIWKSRLTADTGITKGQRNTAVVAVILAGLFSALTTSSFFSYFLPQLFPAAYLSIAPGLNVGAIVGSWIVFLMAIVSYAVFSGQTKQNLAQASANQGIFDARMNVLKGAGEAIRQESDNLINRMDQEGIFLDDARRLILETLGMDPARFANLPTRPATTSRQPQPPTAETKNRWQLPNLLGRSKDSDGDDLYIADRQLPDEPRRKIHHSDNYEHIVNTIDRDARRHAPGTRYWVMSNNMTLNQYHINAAGQLIEEDLTGQPHPTANGRRHEAEAPAGPAAQFTIAEHRPNATTPRTVGKARSRDEADLLLQQAIKDAPNGTRVKLWEGTNVIESIIVRVVETEEHLSQLKDEITENPDLAKNIRVIHDNRPTHPGQ